VGDLPTFSESEKLRLMLAIDFFEITGERRYVAFVRANYLSLFPHLVPPGQYRIRDLTVRAHDGLRPCGGWQDYWERSQIS
jgi:hypothetical protein